MEKDESIRRELIKCVGGLTGQLTLSEACVTEGSQKGKSNPCFFAKPNGRRKLLNGKS